jgi:hypothetical protein
MSKQSKRDSALEAVANIVIGLCISFTLQLVLYPIMEIPVTINQNIIITLVFFIASFVRGYLIRRFFNKF